MKKTRGARKDEYVTVLQRPAELHRAKPAVLQSYPRAIRTALGWVFMILFTLAFLQPVIILILPFPFMWRGTMLYATTSYLGICIISLLMPERELPFLRGVGQLLYEIVDLHSNLNEEDFEFIKNYGKEKKIITCMHPHGVVPFQAILWAAYCDQYLTELYGFGATADIIFKIPFLCNILPGLSAGRAGYKTLLAGLQHGISKPANAAGRKPKHMYILPGGVAEVFFSKRNSTEQRIIFKSRRNLCRLAVQTDSELCPCYVFGGNDFYDNFATGDSFIASFSRKVKAGLTFFTGQYGLPFVPFAPKCTLVLSEPLLVPAAVDIRGKPRSEEERLEELHGKYCEAITHLFDKYKALAGYPNHTLEIV
jgi:hypothetical protein